MDRGKLPVAQALLPVQISVHSQEWLCHFGRPPQTRGSRAWKDHNLLSEILQPCIACCCPPTCEHTFKVMQINLNNTARRAAIFAVVVTRGSSLRRFGQSATVNRTWIIRMDKINPQGKHKIL